MSEPLFGRTWSTINTHCSKPSKGQFFSSLYGARLVFLLRRRSLVTSLVSGLVTGFGTTGSSRKPAFHVLGKSPAKEANFDALRLNRRLWPPASLAWAAINSATSFLWLRPLESVHTPDAPWRCSTLILRGLRQTLSETIIMSGRTRVSHMSEEILLSGFPVRENRQR